MKSTVVKTLGMAEARLKLPALADALVENPDGIVIVTRRGRAVLHLLAAPRIARHASAARRILERVAQLEKPATRSKRHVARRYKTLLYGR